MMDEFKINMFENIVNDLWNKRGEIKKLDNDIRSNLLEDKLYNKLTDDAEDILKEVLCDWNFKTKKQFRNNLKCRLFLLC